MPQLPSGTVTFLFSDIEGSTQLIRRLGDDYAELLETHRALLRRAFTTHGGIELGTEGDSFFVVFPGASGAVLAAVDAQRSLHSHDWPDGADVRVRMGLLTGEAAPRGGQYVGLDVHRAARIGAAGHGGQVLLASSTRELLGHSPAEGLALRDLGICRLKDLEEPERIFQLEIDGLPTDFPPLRGVEVGAIMSLPTHLTTFLGREGEIADVLALFEVARLVTLTGPGGTGKTRLAIEAGRRAEAAFPDGVVFVPLAALREVELVVPAIAAELGLADRGGRAPLERLVEHFGERRILLVLDNFEQVQAASGEVATLLAGAPGLGVLVTSRERLHLYGEHEYAVPALALPSAGAPRDPEGLAAFEAVALFVDRAAAVRHGFRLTAENATTVAEICVRLDGLPLAIELAAARVKLLTPEAILARLDRRLSLGGGGRDLPRRQQTLRDAIAWSHDLLDDDERRLFAALSAFPGGASIEAAESVLAGEAGGDVLDDLASLVDKSLVLGRGPDHGEPRFAMLATVREFAEDQLASSGHGDELLDRRDAFFAGLASRARPQFLGPDAAQWLDAVEVEHDNLRAVLGRATERGEVRLALRLVADLWRYWQRRGYLAEGLARARAALALPGAADDPVLRAAAIEAAGGLAYWQADAVTTQAMYEEGLALARQRGDEGGIAEALYNLSFTYTWLILQDERTDSDPEAARVLLREARQLYERLGDRLGLAKTSWALATTYFWIRDLTAARAAATDALALAHEVDDAFLIGWSLFVLALIDVAERRLPEARGRLLEALGRFADAGDVSAYTLVLDGVAAHALATGDRKCSARISAGVAVLEKRSGTGLNPLNRAILGFEPQELRDDPALADAWAAGERLDDPTLIAEARAWLERSATVAATDTGR